MKSLFFFRVGAKRECFLGWIFREALGRTVASDTTFASGKRLNKIITMTALALFGAAAPKLSAQVELVQNGSFEFSNEQGMTLGWTVSGETGVSDFGFS